LGQARGPQAGRRAQPDGAPGGGDAGMNVLTWAELSEQEQADALERATTAAGPEVTSGVAGILAQVRERGDEALRELTARLDGADVGDLEVAAADRQS